MFRTLYAGIVELVLTTLQAQSRVLVVCTQWSADMGVSKGPWHPLGICTGDELWGSKSILNAHFPLVIGAGVT